MTRNNRDPVSGVLSTIQRLHWKSEFLKVQNSKMGREMKHYPSYRGKTENFNLLTHNIGFKKTYLTGFL